MQRYKSKFEEKLLDIKRIQGIDSLKDTEIYINPKSVNGFPKGVRGVLDKKGNIYLWDNLNVIHTEMFPYLIQNNYINLPDSYKKPKYKILLDTLNYGVVAIQESLKQRGLFYYSESYGYDLAENLKQKIEILFNKAKKKNSQFEFVNTHFWRENNKIGRYKSYFKENTKYKFNTKTTGMSFYDDLLNKKDKADYFKYYKGLTWRIEQMHPLDFLDQTKNKTSRNPLDGMEANKVDKYIEMISKGKKFDMPVLDYHLDGWKEHEGRHRSLAMHKLGITKIDVLVVRRIEPDHDKWFDISMKKMNQSQY